MNILQGFTNLFYYDVHIQQTAKCTTNFCLQWQPTYVHFIYYSVFVDDHYLFIIYLLWQSDVESVAVFDAYFHMILCYALDSYCNLVGRMW